MIGGGLENLSENEGFVTGIAVGMSIYQQKVLTVHEKKEPLEINGELYFIQSGNELLQEMLNDICR